MNEYPLTAYCMESYPADGVAVDDEKPGFIPLDLKEGATKQEIMEKIADFLQLLPEDQLKGLVPEKDYVAVFFPKK